jgi:hypothetical protein
MIHFMLGAIITVVFIAIFWPVIFGASMLLLLTGALAFVAVLLYMLSASFPPIFLVLCLVVVYCALMYLFFTPRSKLSTRLSSGDGDGTAHTKNKKDNRQSSGSMHQHLADSRSIEDFRAKYPFVKIDVPASSRPNFIGQCLLLENKTGHFPSRNKQEEILRKVKVE